MDFRLTEEQQAFADLAGQILGNGASHERMREIEQQDGPRHDPALWAELARSGLLGIAIPEQHGGAGLGFFELALVLEQLGRSAAPVPLLETLVLGALPIAEFGTPAQQRALLPGVVEGTTILSAALVEELADPARPTTTARREAKGWRIDGRKLCVPAGQLANYVLLPASVEGEGIAILLLDPQAPGVRVVPLDTTSGRPQASLELDGVRMTADALLGDVARGAEILLWLRQRATAAHCCVGLGICEAALRLTAEYTKSRKQFGEPIATFQAVGQRQADAYVDTEAIRLTSWQAAWRIANGMPAATEVAVAKYWAALGGQRVVHTAVHQHGGMGVDRDYPLHRYFLAAKQIELDLGGTTHQLLEIGRMLAEQPAA